ncbi:uncharacterized protein LOC132553020 [Ylistrum balloti]|uniref:uncharacterized protein LOC132553020 n=1 Tax=Ylistrum balloti TaxID=509963 RepID=UPI002905C6AD|nr:uncharacterized protein LOC132553020 [Ylistrum balloti]
MLSTHSGHLNFDVPSFLTNEDYVTLTGFTKQQFDEIVTHLTSLNNSAVRSIRTCLAVFLFKLRSGLSNKLIGVLFHLTYSQIQRIVNSTRNALVEDFVPDNLGFQHISHGDFVQNHTTNIAKSLFQPGENEAIVVADGTYVYIQKSADYKFQRRSYSMHKNRPLVKPMMLVGTDGYILDVLGPYLADGSNNDASITKHMLKANEEASKWFKPGDIFIVDRGFRDAVRFLEDRGFDVKMPFYLQKGCKQHSTEEANLSRLVTKVRWVVESVNGRIKQWKLFDKVVPNTLIPSIGDFVRIICALINRFKEPLVKTDATSEAHCRAMLAKSKEPNTVKAFLESNNLLNKRTVYQKLEAEDLMDFPKLSMDDLRNITMGVYQLKQAPSYKKEHCVDDGLYELLVFSENPNLIKLKIQSRHCNSRAHSLWIEYDSLSDDPIKGWYCTCKVGSRVVGCCAHIASALWFLGYERFQGKSSGAVTISTKSLADAADIPTTDSDTDEEYPEE